MVSGRILTTVHAVLRSKSRRDWRVGKGMAQDVPSGNRGPEG